MSGERHALAELPPRLRKVLQLVLKNREAIMAPRVGYLEIHFNGQQVSGRLFAKQGLRLDDEDDGPPSAA